MCLSEGVVGLNYFLVNSLGCDLNGSDIEMLFYLLKFLETFVTSFCI